MTKKEATDGLLIRLQEPFEKRGFSLLKSKLRFQGDSSAFRPIFSFAVMDAVQGSIEFHPQLGLRAEEIEAIVNKASQTPPGTARHSVTLGGEVGTETGEASRWWTMAGTEAELDSAAALMVQALEERAIPFFGKYSNLTGIDEHINADPGAPALLCPADLRRAEAGVVVAQLLARPDLSELIKAHRKFLQHIYERNVPDFEDFIGRLNLTNSAASYGQGEAPQ